MKKINYIKAGLDFIMLIVFVLLFNRMAIAPMVFHQIAGLAIGIVVIVHIALNFKWVKQVSIQLFSSKINLRTKFGYSIDVLLVLCFAIVIISGIPQSKIIYSDNFSESTSLKAIHISISYIALLLVGIHIGLHWNWVVNVFKKIFKISDKKKTLGIIAKLVVVLLLIFGAYNIYSVKYFSKVSSITMTFVGSQSTMEGEEEKHHSEGLSTQGASHSEGSSGAISAPAAPNAFGIISTYISVISAFSIITFYLEKLSFKRKLVKQV